MRRLMIDIEGMSTRPDAAVLQIGAVLVDTESPETVRAIYRLEIDPRDAQLHGHVDMDTLAWWADQDDSLYRRVFGGALSCAEVARDFFGWVRAQRAEEVWARGPQFDVSALEHLARETRLEVPWRYSQVRDLRTLTALFPDIQVGRAEQEIEHDALHDAMYQARVLAAITRHLQRVEELQV